MDRSYSSLASLSDKLKSDEQYGEIRAYIRTLVSASLGEGNRKKRLSDKECVAHSLVANWLETNGYKMSAKMMRIEMSSNYVKEPEQYLKEPGQLMEQTLNGIEVSGSVERKRESVVEGGEPFEKRNGELDKRESKREPIRISPFSDEEWKQNMQRRNEWANRQQPKLPKQPEAVYEEDSDDSSDSSSSSDSSASTSSSEQQSQDERKESEKKKEKSDSEEEEEKSDPEMEKLSWGPSKLALITDLPPIASTSFSSLPSISSKPSLVSEQEENAIDKLFEDDVYELEDFEEEELKLDEVKVEEKKEEEKKVVEESPLSEGESIDELEDFDTGLLSSGGSDYSF